MKRIVIFLIGLFLIYLAYGVALSRFSLNIIVTDLKPEHPNGFYDYRGVINVHTNLSSGSGNIEDIARAAESSEVDFVIVTDLNPKPRRDDLEAYYGPVLVMVDGEYSYLDARLIHLDAESEPDPEHMGQTQTYFNDLLGQREKEPKAGLLALAHPFKRGHKWSGQYPLGLDSIEVINLKSIWQNAYLDTQASFLWTLLIYPFNPDLAFIRLFQNLKNEFHLWDRLNRKRAVFGLAGTDAEAQIKPFGQPISFPSYRQMFRIVSNHVLLRSELTGDFAKDRRKIAAAFRKGQYYMSLDLLAPPKGFNAYITNGTSNLDKRVFPIGSKMAYRPGLRLKVTLPKKPDVPFETVIFRDGEKVMTSSAQETIHEIKQPGTYRATVRVIPTFPLPDGKKWIPWIFTNPFFVN